jgi:hypothetical protein
LRTSVIHERNEGSDPDPGVMRAERPYLERGHSEPAPMSAKTRDGWPAPAPPSVFMPILRKNALESQ